MFFDELAEPLKGSALRILFDFVVAIIDITLRALLLRVIDSDSSMN